AGGLNHVAGLMNWVVLILLFAWLSWMPPRLFGGEGSWEASLRAMAWLSVLAGALQPLPLIAMAMLPQAEIVAALTGEGPEALQAAMAEVTDQTRSVVETLLLITAALMFWLFSSFIAELHRFRATWPVMAVIFGLFLAISALLRGATA
ncbi:MAG: hypothetical protein AAGI70_12080, partial [Pseudomonadota bacterium]